MNSKLPQVIGRCLLATAAAGLLTACDRIMTPDFETEITEIRSGQYTLDPNHATLLWKLNHLGFSTLTGRFNDFDATLDFDPENIENSSVEVIIETAGLDMNLPEFEEELLGENYFNAAQFPQVIYRTTSLSETIDEDSYIFDGELTLRGVTSPVAIEINFNGGGRVSFPPPPVYTIGFSASASFQRSTFGIDRFVSFGVGDEIELEIHVEFQESGEES